ncbi:MAG TPA: TIGR03619 family F420-dependent LLM class oxidoreductase [Candidatus Limnocylindria bacterium]
MRTVGVAVRNFVGPGETPDARALLRYAERAEALGFESVWVWDHILLGVDPAFPILESLSLLAALAVRTERVLLGTSVLVLPLREPVVTAKVLATIDRLSNGRLVVGVAPGWYKREFDAVGVPHEQRGRILERGIGMLTRLWTERPLDMVEGAHHLRAAVMLPPPVQRPRPPILIGGYVDRALRRVARFGDGWLTYFYTPDSVRRAVERIRRHAAEIGRDPAELSVTNEVAILVDDDGQASERAMRSWLEKEWDLSKGSESTFDHAITGNARECAERLREQFEAGVDRLVLVPYRYEPEQLERIAAEVLPALELEHAT